MDFHAVVRALTKRLNCCEMLTDRERDALDESASVQWQMEAAKEAKDIDYLRILCGAHRMSYEERRAYFIEKASMLEQLKLFKAASENAEPEFEDASFGF